MYFIHVNSVLKRGVEGNDDASPLTDKYILNFKLTALNILFPFHSYIQGESCRTLAKKRK